jgi:TonB family protein
VLGAIVLAGPTYGGEAPAGTPVEVPAAPVPAAAEQATAAPLESIEEVLGETPSPLDQVDASIADAEFEAAEQFLTSYIRTVEQAHHRYHPDLVRPLTQLGDLDMERGNYAGAIENYGRAVHVDRVNSGLHSPDQVPVVYKEAAAYRRIGDLTEANNREEYAFEVLRRVHGSYSEEMLPGIYRLADWYAANFNVFAARHLYEQAYMIHERAGTAEQPEAIPALAGIASSYRLERFPPIYLTGSDDALANPAVAASDHAAVQRQQLSINNFPAGERALQQIIQIRQSDPDSTPQEIVEAILDLADWHLLFEHYRHALPLYQHAFESIDALGGDAKSYFGEPKLLHYPVPSNPKAPPEHRRADERAGYVALRFRVTERGLVEDMETIDSVPDGMMDLKVRKAMKVTRYRPVFVDGAPVSTPDVVFQHDFTWFPRSDEPIPESAATADAVAATPDDAADG